MFEIASLSANGKMRTYIFLITDHVHLVPLLDLLQNRSLMHIL